MPSHKYFINQVIHDKTKSFKNLRYYLRLPCLHQRLIQNKNVRNDTRIMKRGTATEQLASRAGLLAVASKHCSLLHNYSSWRVGGEQTLLSVTPSSLWRADYSPWRVMTVFCREVRFLTPKTRFSSSSIPKLIGNSTYDHSTTWTSFIYEFYGLSTLLTFNSTNSTIKSDF